MTRAAQFLRDETGTAVVEFAFMSIILFAVLLPALDFAAYARQKLRLGSAVEQGAMLAFQSRTTVPVVNTSGITTYINAVSGGSATTTFQCNGASTCDASAPSSRCIGAPANAGDWPTFTTPVTVAGVSTCTSGSAPGFYLVIRASQAFRSLAISDRWLGGSTIIQQTAVRL